MNIELSDNEKEVLTVMFKNMYNILILQGKEMQLSNGDWFTINDFYELLSKIDSTIDVTSIWG